MSEPTLPTQEDRELLRDSLRGFLQQHWPAETAVEHGAVAAEIQRIQAGLARQGLTTLGTDPGEGGVQEIVVVQQELGRAACPAPFLAAALANLLLWPLRHQHSEAARLLASLHCGDACLAIAFGAMDGDRTAGTVTAADGRVSGEARYLEAAAAATHLLAVIGESRIALIPVGAGVEILPTRAIGAAGLASVRFQQAQATLLDVDAAALKDLSRLARLGAHARAYGAAARAFELVVEYAKIRKQFGQLIGRFQAIQHKLANNHIALEAIRLMLADTAACYDKRSGGWRFLADAEAAFSNSALRQASLETQHAFGAIGYAEEHEAPRHFKQVHQDVLRFGGARRAREALARHLLDDGLAIPEYDLGPEGNAFRKEVGQWLDQHWTRERQAAMRARPNAHREFDPEFARELGATGWIGLNWPKQFGGQDRSPVEYVAFIEQMERAEAPRAGAPIQSVAWMMFGSEAQQQRYLPEILRGEVIYGMWYSEPDSGSDLASLRTRAVRDGDHWVVNGQKIWTTTYWGDYMWLAARTDAEAKPAHAGISVFCVPTNTPGITIRPMKTMYDGEFVNTFFDNVRIPASALVGKLNGGWEVLTGSLGTERSVVGATVVAKLTHAFELLCDYIRQVETDSGPLRLDPVVRDQIGSLAGQLEAARQLAMHCVTVSGQGESPQHLAAMTKVFGGELMERMFETAQDILGMEAALSRSSPGAILQGRLEQKLRHSLMWVISLGTNEIQRNVIAQRGLGLPR